MLETKIEKLFRYLKQPSTWQGIAMIAAAAGYTITPEYQQAILAGGAIILGLLQCLKDDDKANPAEPVTKPMTNMDIVRVVAAAKQKGLLVLLVMIMPMFLLQGCTGKNIDNGVEGAIAKAGLSTAAYYICKKNPDAIPAIEIVCQSPEALLSEELANLYAAYGNAIDDPFLKMQADIILQAFADEYGVDLADPAFDFSKIDAGEVRPFVDLICAGAAAARAP